MSPKTNEYRLEHRGHQAIIFEKGSQTPIAIAKAPRVGRNVWIEDVNGKILVKAKHRAAYKFNILDNKKQVLAELKRALISRDFTIQYKGHEIKPRGGIGKNGFEAYNGKGKLAFSLQRHPKKKQALWLVTIGDYMEHFFALACAYAIGRVCFTHLSENRGFTLSNCGDACFNDPYICCLCPLLILFIILLLSGMLGYFIPIFQWFSELFP